ncbi:MAG: GTP-binding protein [Candidatus Heimdallarchaeota archaeon]
MENIETSDYIFKILAVGNQSVGKTSITIRFATDKFSDDYKVTLGMNLSTKNVRINDKLIQMAVWDTAGQSSFEPLLPMYYRGALGAIIVYDITNRKSFEGVRRWFRDIKRFAEEIPVIIIGNKSDLLDQRVITYEEGKKLADEMQENWSYEVYFKESSAKEAIEVNESFMILATSILNTVITEDDDDEEEFDFDFDPPF